MLKLNKLTDMVLTFKALNNFNFKQIFTEYCELCLSVRIFIFFENFISY